MLWPAVALAAPLTYTVDETGLSADGLQLGEVRAAIQAGLGTWQAVSCGPCASRPIAKGFGDVGVTAPAAIGLGCVATSATGCAQWGPNGNQCVFIHAAVDWPYSAGVIAMTVLTARTDTGVLVDADIALNDAAFAFCLQSCPADRIHLEAVFRHEAGHFVGLDHSAMPTAVMHGVPPKVIAKPKPMTDDDVAGLCTAYADEVTPVSCAQPVATTVMPPVGASKSGDGGCKTGHARPGWPWPVVYLCLAALGLRLVRRRKADVTGLRLALRAPDSARSDIKCRHPLIAACRTCHRPSNLACSCR